MIKIKEKIKALLESTEYYQLLKIKEEWEEQNVLIDEQFRELTKKTNKIKKMAKEIEEYNKVKDGYIREGQKIINDKNIMINELELKNVELTKKIKDKESARRKLASKIGGYQAKINKLEHQVEFLKTNRRSPNLEEIKDYEYRRKRGTKDE